MAIRIGRFIICSNCIETYCVRVRALHVSYLLPASSWPGPVMYTVIQFSYKTGTTNGRVRRIKLVIGSLKMKKRKKNSINFGRVRNQVVVCTWTRDGSEAAMWRPVPVIIRRNSIYYFLLLLQTLLSFQRHPDVGLLWLWKIVFSFSFGLLLLFFFFSYSLVYRHIFVNYFLCHSAQPEYIYCDEFLLT